MMWSLAVAAYEKKVSFSPTATTTATSATSTMICGERLLVTSNFLRTVFGRFFFLVEKLNGPAYVIYLYGALSYAQVQWPDGYTALLIFRLDFIISLCL